MGPDFIDSWSLRAVFDKDFHDQIFELVRKTALCVDLREVLVEFSMSDKIVKVVTFSCLKKWKNASHETEDQDTDRKNVNLFTVVDFSFHDLWCHVALRSNIVGELFNVFVGCKAKIKKFDVHIFINENIFWFDVSVYHTTFVNVFDCIENLMHDEPCLAFSHSSTFVEGFLEIKECFS